MTSFPSIPGRSLPDLNKPRYSRIQILCPQADKPLPVEDSPSICEPKAVLKSRSVYRSPAARFVEFFDGSSGLQRNVGEFLQAVAVELAKAGMLSLEDVVREEPHVYTGLTAVALLKMLQHLNKVELTSANTSPDWDGIPVHLYGLREYLGSLPSPEVELVGRLLIRRRGARVEEAPENAAAFYCLYDGLKEMSWELTRSKRFRKLFDERFRQIKVDFLVSLEAKNRLFRGEEELFGARSFSEDKQVLILSTPF